MACVQEADWQAGGVHVQGHTTIVPVATLSRALLQDTASSGSTLSSTNDSKEAITDSTAASYASSDTTDAGGVTVVSGTSDEDQSPLKAVLIIVLPMGLWLCIAVILSLIHI